MEIAKRKVPLGRPLFPEQKKLSSAELEQLETEDRIFAHNCREIFNRVYPELVAKYYNWFIVIEPESKDYFIDRHETSAWKCAKQKYPNSMLLIMRINETGTCGRIYCWG
jgi:hypothetical protein